MSDEAEMSRKLGDEVTELQVAYRAANATDRMALRPKLDDAIAKFNQHQTRMIMATQQKGL